jgi:hypothetical protein
VGLLAGKYIVVVMRSEFLIEIRRIIVSLIGGIVPAEPLSQIATERTIG